MGWRIQSVRRRFGAGAMLLALAAAMPAAAGARGPETGWYVGLAAIGAIADLDGISTDGFTGTEVLEYGKDEVVGGGAVTVGYSWREIPLRTELELAHRYRIDLDMRDVRPGGIIDYGSNIATTSLLMNAVLEWRNGSSVTPFAGLSIGAALHDADTTRLDLATGAKTRRDHAQARFAWGLMLGLDWDFAERWTAEAAYRFINLGEVTTGTLLTGERIDADDYVSHDLLLSVQYRF